MKFPLDDNVPYSLKIFLTGKNIECVKPFEVSLKGIDDEEEKQSDEGIIR